jgi:hypothetical protein
VDKRAGDGKEMNKTLIQVIRLGIFLAISIGISMILPFPLSFIVIIGFFILISMYGRNTIMKRMGVWGDNEAGMFPPGGITDNRPLKYYCMICGKEHREAFCPNCASKMKGVSG